MFHCSYPAPSDCANTALSSEVALLSVVNTEQVLKEILIVNLKLDLRSTMGLTS